MPGEVDAIIAYLRESDARCPVCAYRLRGVRSGRCPECGSDLTLRLETRTRRSVWRLAGILGAGWSSVLLLAVVVRLTDKVVHELEDPTLRMMVSRGLESPSALAAWQTIVILTALACMLLTAAALLIVPPPRLTRAPAVLRLGICLLAALSPLIVIAALRAIGDAQ